VYQRNEVATVTDILVQMAGDDADIEAGIRAGLPTYKIYESLIFADIRNACDILRSLYEA